MGAACPSATLPGQAARDRCQLGAKGREEGVGKGAREEGE